MNASQQLRELSQNLYWAWHPEVINIFRDMDAGLWHQVNRNPVEFLSRLADRALEKAASPKLREQLARALAHLHRYLESRNSWGDWNAGPLRVRPVAYFSAEFGIHESLPNYAGGLGVLAGDHLKAASDLAVPMVGVGLYYAHGYFDQSLDANGWQQEHYPRAPQENLPLELVRDSNGQPLRIALALGDRDIHLHLWTAAVGRNHLLLLDSNLDSNGDDYRALTSQLYGGDRNVRIHQEAILGIGGMRALQAIGVHPGVIHMNEGHSAFAVLELARHYMDRDGQPFRNTREMAASVTVFTTHTPVDAGHDRFDADMVERVLGQFRQQLGLSHDEFMELGRIDPHDPQEPFCMTVLGLKMSRHRNAVSALHGHISRAMWRRLWPQRPQDEIPIGYITNGVHLGTWLSEPMRRLYDRHLGPDWENRMDDPSTWLAIDQIEDLELWQIDQQLRQSLIDYVRRNLVSHAQARGESLDPASLLNPSALTIAYARRFATYKRGDLLLRDLDRLDRLVNNPDRPVQFIIAGKAHPGDDSGKRTIQKIFQATRVPRFRGKIVFVENYNMNVARHLVQGADLWLNNPRRPLEACGTSGQKVAINAGLNLSILDGWWAEAFDNENGFAIGTGGEHSDWERQDESDAASLYDVLENQVIPMFFQCDAQGIPTQWIARQRHALRTLAWRFSARRMVLDYTEGCYLPAAGGLTASRNGAPFRHPTVPVPAAPRDTT